MNQQTPPSSMSRQRKWLTILLVVIVYVPLIHNALLGQPAFIPWRMNEFWRFTDLFPYATAVWPVNQVFVQGADDEWRQVPQTPLFQHNLFGRMTRLDMLHLMLSPGRADDATTLEVKRGIFARVCHAFAAAHDAEDGEAAAVLRAEGYPPIPRPVRAVRLVTVWLPVVDEPTRRWSSWPPVDYSAMNQDIRFECRIPPVPPEQ